MSEEYLDQPAMESWKFTGELKTPLHEQPIKWSRSRAAADEVSLTGGVNLEFDFPDPEKVLDTAYIDFRRFLVSAGIAENGSYRISIRRSPTTCFEEYELDIRSDACLIKADDTEGIRRGLIALEDMICRCCGPFLPLGKIRRKPFVKTRLSRCAFGPINRPPMNRDELMDDVDYYHGEYLNRLAHEGVNALWISAEFSDLCPSKHFPSHGKDAKQRFAKLKKTIQRCRQYGISIFLLCNEPRAFGGKSYIMPLESENCLKENPFFRGHTAGNQICFCTSSPQAQEYLEACTNHIFSQVPELGGLINISFGERPSHCFSGFGNIFNSNCPRCSTRKPEDVFHEMLSAMARGMKKAAPSAKFISWFYIPSMMEDRIGSIEKKGECIRQIASALPEDITMQINFESNGTARQLGRDFTVYDYHLAYIGPSRFFREWSAAAIAGGTAVSAKLQTGCSHENATIPFIPVPGNLYKKYRAAKQCKVSTVMQSWYFGNWPGVMNKAAGELSFLPFPRSEKSFLETLARIDWAEDYQQAVKAWQYFMKGYAYFPMELSFAWFGPLHCSIVWPLHLFPADKPIAPSWEFGFPDSGDRIGECAGASHTLDEVLYLLGKMNRCWQRGIEILTPLKKRFSHNKDRLWDIGTAEAIGLQINSSFNIFKFYDLREKLPYMQQRQQLAALKKMTELVKCEIQNSQKMKLLCLQDSRIGFHPEAEGYKFFPEKLQKRIGKLKKLLRNDFPALRVMIKRKELLFGEYTGRQPEGESYICGKSAVSAALKSAGEMQWAAWHDEKMLYFRFIWNEIPDETVAVCCAVEPRRLWPAMEFISFSNGKKSYYDTSLNPCGNWSSKSFEKDGKLIIETALPFDAFTGYTPARPLRINISCCNGDLVPCGSWIKKHPLKPRLLFGDYNSADLGWLIID